MLILGVPSPQLVVWGAHTTNFSDLVDVVVSCGGENFLRKQERMLHTHQKML